MAARTNFQRGRVVVKPQYGCPRTRLLLVAGFAHVAAQQVSGTLAHRAFERAAMAVRAQLDEAVMLGVHRGPVRETDVAVRARRSGRNVVGN